MGWRLGGREKKLKPTKKKITQACEVILFVNIRRKKETE
jgi:hypothetical protein